jgi:benzoyl-CoA reductase/2-hydroxyglutaryl-CoA dehydratase subunit BcrC/BadD/HgdB
MNDDAEINIFRSLDFIRDNAPAYAKAKATRVYLDEYRKTKKALCMRDAEIAGHKTAATQEREAYAHPEYIELLEGLRAAVEEEERLRWLIVGAQAKISAWQTIEATRRLEAKAFPS